MEQVSKIMGVTYNIDGVERLFPDGTSEEEAKKIVESLEKKEEAREKDSEYEGIGQELFEGAVTGVSKIPQGILEGGASIYDYFKDTDKSKEVTKFFETSREKLGLDPAGFVGKGAEVVTQFGLPGLGAASLVSKLSKAPGIVTKALSSRVGQVGAAGAADTVVATNDLTSIGDFVGGGITETDQRENLTGSEEAKRRLKNKFKLGTEAAAITTVAPTVIGAVGAAVSPVASKILSPVAKGAKKINEKASNLLKRLGIDEDDYLAGKNQNVISEGVNLFLSKFRYKGFLPEEAADQRLLISGKVSAEVKEAQITYNSLEKNINKSLNKFAETSGLLRRGEDTQLLRQEIFENINTILTTPLNGKLTKNQIKQTYKNQIKQLPENMRPALNAGIDDLVKMRTQIDNLSKNILDSDFIKNLENISDVTKIERTVVDDLKEQITNNLGSYMRRKYKVFEDAKFEASEESLEVAAAAFKNDPQNLMKELVTFAEDSTIHGGLSTDDVLRNIGVNTDEGRRTFGAQGPTIEQGRIAAENFFGRFKSAATDKFNVSSKSQRVADQRVNTGMFLEDNKIATDYQRELLGEIKSPREAFLNTVADLSEFRAVDDYFGKLRELADNKSGLGKFFVNTAEMTSKQISDLKRKGYVMLGENVGAVVDNLRKIAGKDIDSEAKKIIADKAIGSIKNNKFGSLSGYMVPEAIYNNLTKNSVGSDSLVHNTLGSLYSTFLRGKALSQYSKTVLSPPTQIRNFVSGANFAAAQGNIGTGSSVRESLNIVFNDIAKKGSQNVRKELEEMDRLGILSTDAEIKELQELISKGAYESGNLNFVKRVGGYLGKIPGVTKTFGSLGKGNKFMQDLYQGGDNVWKIYNYKFEVSKLEKALKNADQATVDKFLGGKTINEMAASIVRDTVPNYNKVPEIVRGLRKLPVGSFISFPAEILRTGANTIARGIDELASDVPEIQQIGLRRLSGMAATAVVAPQAISQFAHTVSGVAEEQMNAFRRSFGAPWEKNARLIGVDKKVNDDGEIVLNYVNYSYSNPYEYIDRMLTSSVNKYEEAKRLGQSTEIAVNNAFFETINEFVKPFASETILAEKLRDVLPRITEEQLRTESEQPIIGSIGTFIGARGGKTLPGNKIYRDTDSKGTKIVKSLKHIFDAFLPPLIPLQVKSGEFTASPVSRALINELGYNEQFGVKTKDKLKREVDLSEQIFNTLTGFKTIEVKLNDALKYAGHDFSKNNREAVRNFNEIANDTEITADEIVEAYQRANDTKFKVHNDFFLTVNDAKKLGMSEGDIITTLKQNNIQGFSEATLGIFKPIEVSKNIENTFALNNNIEAYVDALPRIIEIQNKFRDKVFTADKTEDLTLTRDPTGKFVIGAGEMLGETIGSAMRGEIPLIPEAGAAEVTPNVVAPPVNVPPPSPASSVGEINPLLVPNPTTRATFGSQ